MNINVLAVPAMIVLVLTYLFQDIKPALESVPGLRPGDPTHDDGLRVVYGLLAFAAVLAYALYTQGLPADWLSLLVQVGATAVSMAVGGHYLYQRVSGAASTAAASSPDGGGGGLANDVKPGDYPPGLGSADEMGLPVTSDQQQQAVSAS